MATQQKWVWEKERERIQLAMCILMCLKSSRVMPFSLSSGCTTSTSSWSNNCLLSKDHRNKTDPISKNMKNKNPKNKKHRETKWNLNKSFFFEGKIPVRWCPEIGGHVWIRYEKYSETNRDFKLMSMLPDGSRFLFDSWRSKVKSVVWPVEKSLGPRRLHFNLGPLAKATDLSNLGLERGPSIEWASYRSVWSLCVWIEPISKERGWFFSFFKK